MFMAMPPFSTAFVPRSALGLFALTACSLASACSLTLLSVEQARGAVARADSQTGQPGAGVVSRSSRQRSKSASRRSPRPSARRRSPVNDGDPR